MEDSIGPERIGPRKSPEWWGRRIGGLKKILIVEDDQHIRKLLHILIRRDDINIDEAVEGNEALDKLQNNTYDLVILDIMMPNVDGFSILKQMRENAATSTLPVIIVTAKTEDKDLMKGYSMGANYYITKPFEPQDLIHSIELILKIKY
ncbi:MAG: response regulator [Armatimonadetes bacterium]|nr:response regulator [Armatimonadota bacterium]